MNVAESELIESLPINNQMSASEAALLRTAYRERLRRYSPLPPTEPDDTVRIHTYRYTCMIVEDQLIESSSRFRSKSYFFRDFTNPQTACASISFSCNYKHLITIVTHARNNIHQSALNTTD